MSEAPQPAPVESNLPSPVEGMSYGATLDVATKNYANGMAESGIVMHVPTAWSEVLGAEPTSSSFVSEQQSDQAEEAVENKESIFYRAGLKVGKLLLKKTAVVNAVTAKISERSPKQFTEEDLKADMQQVRIGTKNGENEKYFVADDQFVPPNVYHVNDNLRDFHIAKTKEMADRGFSDEALDVMMTGKLFGKAIDNMDDFSRDGGILLDMRTAFAEILTRDPELAKVLVENDIVGLHGTRSAAFAGILEQGALLSAAEAKRRSISHVTGEHIFQRPEGQGSISFTNLADSKHAFHYAGSLESQVKTDDQVIADFDQDLATISEQLAEEGLGQKYRKVVETMRDETTRAKEEFLANPTSLQAELLKDSFPMLFGIRRETVFEKDEKIPDSWYPIKGTSSSYNEFRAGSEHIDLDKLMVAVPRDRMDKVKVLLQQYGKTNAIVVPMEPLINDAHRSAIERYGSFTEAQ